MFFCKNMTWNKIQQNNVIKLYAGNITRDEDFPDYIGLSISKNDYRHIKHDVNDPINLKDDSVDVYQSEDVFEHIPYENVLPVINEIYRVLKPNGFFRLSLPDYGCDILKNRSHYNINGDIVFDPEGGGFFQNGQIKGGGHLWFPTYKNVSTILENSKFSKIDFLHYYDGEKSITNKIDHSLGRVLRTPDFDDRVKNPFRAMSLVVDLEK